MKTTSRIQSRVERKVRNTICQLSHMMCALLRSTESYPTEDHPPKKKPKFKSARILFEEFLGAKNNCKTYWHKLYAGNLFFNTAYCYHIACFECHLCTSNTTTHVHRRVEGQGFVPTCVCVFLTVVVVFKCRAVRVTTAKTGQIRVSGPPNDSREDNQP